MKEKLIQLIRMAMRYQASDLHFLVDECGIQVSLRGVDGIRQVHSALFDLSLFNYLKYIANLDLGNAAKPQSGNFQLEVDGNTLYFRFSLITSMKLQTAVLRILNNHRPIQLSMLCEDKEQLECFTSWTRQRSGMVILSGPTGSGKTTTLHALLAQIAAMGKLKIITLEDPIEIFDDRYLQLAVNEASGFTYQEGIRQLLRHDPDVIMIGEIRDEDTARMAYRCALTGHMVYSCVHAKSATEAVKRLCELGLSKIELQDTLSAICSQRLYPAKQKKGERICIYEILQKQKLQAYLAGKEIPDHQDILYHIRQAITKGRVDIAEAQSDLLAEDV